MTKLYPPLEQFLITLVYGALTVEHIWSQMIEAGIRSQVLPHCDARDILGRLEQFKEFRRAQHELQGDLAFLERYQPDLTQIPRDSVVLIGKLNELLKLNEIVVLGLLCQEQPNLAMNKIISFQQEFGPRVECYSFEDIPAQLFEIRKKVKDGTSQAIIPGFEQLSGLIGGFGPWLTVLLANTGFGKTMLALQLALRARFTMAVFYANLEMQFATIVRRLATLETKIEHKDFFQSVLSDEWISKVQDAGKGFDITGGQSITPGQFKSTIRTLNRKREFPIELAVLDYDQCLVLESRRDKPQWEVMHDVLADLDNFAQDVGCHVMVVAQVNRDGEISSSHRSLFKAHTVMHFRDHDSHGPLIEIKKNRHGPAGKAVKVEYDQNTSQIREIDVISLMSPNKRKREIKVPENSSEMWWNQQ